MKIRNYSDSRDKPCSTLGTKPVARPAEPTLPRQGKLYARPAICELGWVPVGAFDETVVARVLGVPKGQRVLHMVPMGRTSR